MEELESHKKIKRRKVIDKHPKIKRNIRTNFMTNFSSEEMESQYNLTKKLLSNRIKYNEVLKVIKKEISYMLFELKKKLEEENIFNREKRVKMVPNMIRIL